MSVVVEPRAAATGRAERGGVAEAQRVGPVPRTGQNGSRRHARESLVIFAVFGAAYGLLGYWLVVHMHVVTFDALDRLSGAYLAWHGSPAKLAAVGFSLPPLQTLVLLPFTLISSMATSLVALPICSAIFAGLTMAAVNRLLDRCDMTPAVRYPVLVLLAVVPTIAFYSAGGDSEMLSMFLLATAISALIAWFRTVDTRFLISSSMAFGLAAMADYSNVVWMALAAAMVASVLSRHGADDAEVEGSLITYVAPTLYAIALWCLCNWLIVSAPFGWITAGVGATVNVASSQAAGHGVAVGTAFVDALRLALDAAPLSLVIAPALIAMALVQRNELAGWLAAFTVLAVLRPGAEAVAHANIGDIAMSLSAPQLLMAVAGAGWIYQSFPDARALIGGGLVVGLLVTIAIVWHGSASYPYQDMEQAFRATISHPGRHAPETSRGGLQVGVVQEQRMADYIRDHVHDRKSILTDNSQTYGVILLSGEPGLFRTRLDAGNGMWLSEVKNPPRAVKYFLVAYHDAGDALHASYSGAVTGGRRGLSVVYKDARYALLSVTAGTNVKNSTPEGRNLSLPQTVIAVNSLQ